MEFHKILSGGRRARVDREINAMKLTVAFRMQTRLNERIEESTYAYLVFSYFTAINIRREYFIYSTHLHANSTQNTENVI
jgi:hypothetical protein